MLTVVTASHRNPAGLRRLADDLVPFLCNDLHWRIKDSGACPETASWSDTMAAPHISYDDTPDSGIYDALNQAIADVSTVYYLVVGSDDRLHGEVLRDLAKRLAAGSVPVADVLTFPIETAKGIRRRKRFLPLWVSSSSLTSSHSVGTLIKRSLHDRIGFYDTRFRVLADSLFLRTAFLKGASFHHHSQPALGVFGLDGVSSRDHGRRVVETYSYLVASGSATWLQASLLYARTLRYRPKSLL
jgi:hypothetical protein